MTRRRLLTFAFVVLTLTSAGSGCVRVGQGGSVVPPEVSPSVADPPWEVRALFSYGDVRQLAGEPRHFIAQGVRIAVEGDEVRFASDHSYEPIRCGARIEGGYAFLTDGGAIYTADDFLGALTQRGVAPGVTRCLASRGVLVAVEAGNDLHFVGVGGERWRLPEGLRGHVVDAAFRAPREGIVIVAPGVALLTHDNVSYTPVSFGGRVALEALPEAAGWLVRTSNGWFAVSEAGAASALAEAPELDRAPLATRLLERLDHAATEREPFAFSDALPGPDGRLLVHMAPDDDEDAEEDEPASDMATWTAAGGLRALDRPAGDCSTWAWGGRALVRCGDVVHLQVGDDAWRRVEVSAEERLVAAADGSSFATLDACGADRDRAAQTSCGRDLRVYDGERWRTRTLERRVTLVDVHASLALVQEAGTRALRVVSVESPAQDRTLRTGEGSETLFARFDASGGVWGAAWGERRDEASAVVALYAPPGEPLAEVRLPEGALGFEMADARHGMAVGDRLDQVWVTTDGARTWARLDVPVAGAPADVELPRRPRGERSPALRCSALACRVDYTWVWGAPSVVDGLDPGGRVLVAPAVLAPEALLWPGSGSGAQRRVLQCDLPGAAEPEVADFERYATGSLRFADGRLSWSFHEGARVFEAVSAELSDSAIGPDEFGVGALEPLWLTRRFAVFDHCTQPMDADEPDPPLECGALWVVRAGGEAEWLEIPGSEHVGRTPLQWVAALALPRGRSALHFRSGSEGATQRDVLVELDADGVVVGTRLFAFPPTGHVRWLALRASTAGLLVGGPGSPELRFHGLDGSAQTSLSLPAAASIGVCSGAASGTTVVLSDAVVGIRLETGAEASRFYTPVLRIAGGNACLLRFQPRSARRLVGEPSDPVSRWLSFESRRGTLYVRSVEPGGDVSEPVACSLPVAP